MLVVDAAQAAEYPAFLAEVAPPRRARNEAAEIYAAPTQAEIEAVARATAGSLPDGDLYHIVLSHDVDGDETSGRVSISQAGRRYVSIDAETAVTLRQACP